MADTVTSQTLLDEPNQAIMRFTSVSDGTGESAVTKVDISALIGNHTRAALRGIHCTTVGMTVALYFGATTDVLLHAIPASTTLIEHYGSLPIRNNAGSGVTGDIVLTTTGHTAGDKYVLTLWIDKYTP